MKYFVNDLNILKTILYSYYLDNFINLALFSMQSVTEIANNSQELSSVFRKQISFKLLACFNQVRQILAVLDVQKIMEKWVP